MFSPKIFIREYKLLTNQKSRFLWIKVFYDTITRAQNLSVMS